MSQLLSDINSRPLTNLKVTGLTSTVTGSFSVASNVISTLPIGHGILIHDRVSYSVVTSAVLTENGLVAISDATGLESGTGILIVDQTLSNFLTIGAVQSAFPTGTLISFQSGILNGATVQIKTSALLGGLTAVDGATVGSPGYWVIAIDLLTATGFPVIASYPSSTVISPSISIYVGVNGSTPYNDLTVTSTTSTSVTVAENVPNSSFTNLTFKKHSRIVDSLVVDEADFTTLRVQGSPIVKGLRVPYSQSITDLTTIFYGYDTSNNIISGDSALSGEVAASDSFFTSKTIYNVESHPLYPNIGVMCYFNSGDSKNYIVTFTYEYNVGYTFNTPFEIVGSDTTLPSDIYMLFSTSWTAANELLSAHLVVVGGKSSPGTSVYMGAYSIDNLGNITQDIAWGNTGSVIGAGTFSGFVKAQDLKEINSSANSYRFVIVYDTDKYAMFIIINNVLNFVDSGVDADMTDITNDLLGGQTSSFLAIKYSSSKRRNDVGPTTIPTNAYATIKKFFTGTDRAKISLYHLDRYTGFGKSEFDYTNVSGDFTPVLNKNYFVWPNNFQNAEDKDQNIVFELDNCIVFYKSFGYVITLDKATGHLVSLNREGSNTFTKTLHYRTSCLINSNVLLLDVGGTTVANRVLNHGPYLAVSKNTLGEAIIPKSGDYIQTSYNLQKGKEYSLCLGFNGSISEMKITPKQDFSLKKLGIAVDTNKFYVY